MAHVRRLLFLVLAALTLALLSPAAWAFKCDVDGNGFIDLRDLALIQQGSLARARATGPDDPRDADNNGVINAIDGRICALRCKYAACASNGAPLANAGPDQTVRVTDRVRLTGAASSDPDGDALRYTWTLLTRPAGSAAVLADATTVSPSLTADRPGNYVVQLVVNDGKLASAPDSVTLSTENSAPVANAGPDQTVFVGATVVLDGRLSSDVDGDLLHYTWEILTKPLGSFAALSDPTAVQPWFIVDLPGAYHIQLIVSDGTLQSRADLVIVSTQNSPPVARPGANRSVPLASTVQLDGSASSDVDGDRLGFTWALLSKPSGSTAVLIDPATVTPRFTADRPGAYVVQLIVNDGSTNSAPASVTITTENAAPLASAGPDQTVPLGARVQLDGSSSSDPEGAPLTYTWALTTRPTGSAAVLDNPGAANPQFTADRPGIYVAQLIVSDGSLASAPDTVVITTENSRPVADPGPAQNVNTGSTVQLDGSASRDADGDPLTYAWALTTRPAGSTAALSDPAAVKPSFTAGKDGRYIAQLIVSDGRLGSAPATVTIDASTANRAPVAVAKANPNNPVVGATVSLNGSASSDPDNDPITYAWTLSAKPGASNATLTNANAANATLVPDVPGSYTAQLTVSDGRLNHSALVTIVAVGAPINQSPTAQDDSYGLALPVELAVITFDELPQNALMPIDQYLRLGVLFSGGSGGQAFVWGGQSFPSVRDNPFGGAFSLPNAIAANSGATGTVVARFVDPVTGQPSVTSFVQVGVSSGPGPDPLSSSVALLGYDAAGNLLASARPDTSQQFATLSIRAPGIARVEMVAGTLLDVFDDFTFAAVARGLVVGAPGVLLNDSDPDNNPITAAIARQPNRGTVALKADGSFVYTPTPPAPLASLNVRLKWAWTSSQVQPSSLNVIATPAVIDLNGDGIPDIVFGSTSSTSGADAAQVGVLRALSGADGRELFTVTDPDLQISTGASVAVADLDGDGKPEIVVSDASHLRLIAFTHDGKFKWRSLLLEPINGGAAAIADLDGDGRPEIIVGRQVLNSDGSLRWTGTAGHGGHFFPNGQRIGPLSIVADIDLDGVPEVIAGNTAYRADGSVKWQAPLPDGYVAIGNFDDDPFPEVVLVADGQVWLLDHNGVAKWGPVAIPGGGPGGPPVVADVDGDGKPDIGVAGSTRFTVFGPDGTSKWSVPTQDRSSGITGASVFDFDGDGTAEIVYRDELRLRIYRGRDGAVLFETPLNSCTLHEYPVIADVDGDGHAEIVIGANTNCAFGPLQGIYVFADAGSGWMPTRKLWNQHSYHVTNVNEDGSIPRREDINWLIPGLNNFRLNTFGPRDTAQADSFTYRASDGSLQSNEATVRLVLQPQNRAPVFTSAPLLSGTVGQLYIYDANAVDPDAGDTLTFSLVTAPAEMTINPATGLIQWTPTPSQAGVHRVVFRVQDQGGLFATQEFTVTVAAPSNRPPVAVDDAYTVEEDGSLCVFGTPAAACDPPPRRAGATMPYVLDPRFHIEVFAKVNAPLALEASNPLGPFGNFLYVSTGDLRNTPFESGPPDTIYRVHLVTRRVEPFFALPPESDPFWMVFGPGAPYTNGLYISSNNRDGGQPGDQGGSIVFLDPDPGVRGEQFLTPVPPPTVLSEPNAIAFGPGGGFGTSLYVDNSSNPPQDIAIISPSGVRTTFKVMPRLTPAGSALAFGPGAGFGTDLFVGDSSDGVLYRVDSSGNMVAFARIPGVPGSSLDGTISGLAFNVVGSLGESGFLLARSLGRVSVYRLSPSGTLSEFATGFLGITDGSFEPIGNFDGVAASTDGSALFVSDMLGNSVYRISARSSQSASPGLLANDSDPDGQPITAALVSPPANGAVSVNPDGTFAYTPRAGFVGTDSFTYRANDGVADSNPATVSITVTAVNRGPIITSAPVTAAEAGQPYRYDVDAVDPDIGGSVSFSLTGAPSGMTIQAASGLIGWTPATDQAGNQPVIVRVTDQSGLFTEQSFTVDVALPHAPPTFTSTPVTAAISGQPYEYDVGAIDNLVCSSGNLVLNGSFEQSTVNDAATLSNGSTAITGWTVGGVTIDYTSNVHHWNAADGVFSVDLEGSNHIPSNQGSVFQVVATIPGETYRVAFDLSGNPAGGPLIKQGRITFGVESMSFDYNIGSYSTHPYNNTITYVHKEFLFTATGAATTLELASLGSSGYGPVIDNVRVVAGCAPLSFALAMAPTGMSINAATGLIAWTPAPSQVGTHNVAVRATDSSGLSALQSFAVVVSASPPKHAPTITSMPVAIATVGQLYSYQVAATDTDPGDVLTFSLPTAPAGMAINPATGLVTWTPNFRQVGNQAVTVRATDSGGLTAEQGFTIVVSPPPVVNEPPAITSTAPTTATVGTPYSYVVEATDPNAGDVLSYSLTTHPVGMTIDPASGLIQWTPDPTQVGNQPVIVKVQDPGGLFGTQSFTVTVGPALACAPPPAGLTSWWAGEGDGLDRANTNHGTLENGAAFAAGRVGQTLRFDGADDQVRVPNSRTLGAAGPFTVEFWFNPTTTINAASPNHVLLAKGRYLEGGFNAPVAIQTIGGDGRLLVRMPPAPALVSTTTTWPAGTWQHVALSWDGARYRLYVNGFEEAGLDNAFSIFDSTEPITLGNAEGFAAAGFAGLLDEVSLYQRALGAAEIAALHAVRDLGKCTATYSRADAGDDRIGVNLGATVTLDASASRAFDGAALTYAWTLTTRPAGSNAVLANPDTVSPGFVADRPGSYSAQLVVGNAGRISAPDSVEITAANHPPVINSVAPTAARVGSAYTYAVIATDPDPGDVLGYALPVAPAGMTINASTGLVQWNPAAGQVGSHNVTLRVQDAGGLFATQAFVIVVVAAPVQVAVPDVVGLEEAAARASLTAAALSTGTVTLATSPTVPAGRVISQNPSAGAQVAAGSAVALVVSSGPPQPTVVSIRITPQSPLILTGQSQAFSATGILSNGSSLPLTSSLTWTSSNPAVVGINAAGVASALAAGSSTITVTQGAVNGSTLLSVAQSVPDSTLPVAQITSPADDASISAAVPVLGTASDANFLKYVVEIAPLDTGVYSTIAVGSAPVVNGTLATLDPTTLVNDLYVLRLTVIDKANNTAQTEITVQVMREKKVGNFTLAFQDVNVPVAGIPISVVRSYDSRDKVRGDFGIGWRLDVNSLRLRTIGVEGTGWRQTVSGSGLGQVYRIDPTSKHRVMITLPDGKVEEFDFTISPTQQQASPIRVVTYEYKQRGLTRGTLKAVGAPSTLETPGSLGDIEFFSDLAEGQLFQVAAYDYTTPEGQIVRITRAGVVQSITDRNGNTVSFGPGGIIHSAGKSILFARDGQGRITSVTDPLGRVQTYTYDINGDLASHTDALGNRTGYLYNFSHGLIEITDPRGVKPIRNDYDADGRLISTTDAFGKTITYTHDLGANREVITDRLGNQTIHVYDDQGNVTQTADALGGVTTRSYDGRGNTLAETDPLGRTRSHTYDGQDNRLTETDPLGKVTTYTYNGTRQVLSVTDALGRVTGNAYDANGNLTQSTDPAGQVTRYAYDARGLQTTRTDALGNVSRYAYDATGNLASETDALGRVTTHSYDAAGNRLTQATTRSTAGGPQVLSTAFVYDANNRLTQTTHPDGSVTRVAYNAIGKQDSTTDALGRQTRYEYDAMGRLARTTYPDGTVETSAYDAEGRRTTSTDRAGRSTSHAYDALGRLATTTFADGTRTSTAYDAAGQVLSSTDARGNATTYAYDSAGRRSRVTDATGAVTQFAYDDLGNQTRVTDANGHAVQFAYDTNNRRTRTVYADATNDQVAYDALGRQVAKTDQAGKTTQYGYDALGRLIRVTDALGQVTSYSYDELGNQLTQTDAEGRTTSFAYDSMGRRIRRTLPLGMSESMSYDAAGNLKTKTDFNGKTTTYAYDSVNRLLSKTPDPSLAGQASIAFTYTPSGQRATMQDASGSTSYGYDTRDRLVSKATPQGTLSYSHDAAGNVTRIRSARVGGADMSYAWDVRNRLASVTDANGATTYSYDLAGNLRGFLYPNGVEHRYTYNALNRLVNLTGAKGATTIAGYTYTLGPAGNRTAVTEASGRRVDYSYDALYRLVGETISADPSGPNGAIGYVYDRVGNRLTRTSTVAGIDAQVLAYDANDRITTESYDDNGNTLGSGGRTFGYDFENRLVSADGGVSFVYNGDGIRVGKTAGGVTTGFLVDDRNPTGYAQVMEEVVGGAVERSYTWGVKLISQKQASGVSFYGFDGHGSARFLTTTSGLILDQISYDAFGNAIAQIGSTPIDYQDAGERYDNDIDLYYLRARDMSPRTGRFLATDRFAGSRGNPISLHKYVYADANPINGRDPTGNRTLTEVMTTVAVLGTLTSYFNHGILQLGMLSMAAGGSAVPDGAIVSIGLGGPSGAGFGSNLSIDLIWLRSTRQVYASVAASAGLSPLSYFRAFRRMGLGSPSITFGGLFNVQDPSDLSEWGITATWPLSMILRNPRAISSDRHMWGALTQLARTSHHPALLQAVLQVGVSLPSLGSAWRIGLRNNSFSSDVGYASDPIEIHEIALRYGWLAATIQHAIGILPRIADNPESGLNMLQ